MSTPFNLELDLGYLEEAMDLDHFVYVPITQEEIASHGYDVPWSYGQLADLVVKNVPSDLARSRREALDGINNLGGGTLTTRLDEGCFYIEVPYKDGNN